MQDTFQAKTGVFFFLVVSKKLVAGAKQSGCGALKPWVRSISNHLYWAAASSAGQLELIVPKWTSLVIHSAANSREISLDLGDFGCL